MKIITDISQIRERPPFPVITIGNFDGVHLGHQALFNAVKKKAAANGGTSMVMTFEPHPLRVLDKDRNLPLITLYDQKMELINAQGIDMIICLPFDRKLAGMEPEDFVRGILVEGLGVKAIVIGYDYRFGRQGRGDRKLLMELGERYGFEVITLGPQENPELGVISSTRIRGYVSEGRVDEAPKLLGRPYTISGTVVRGKDRGGKLLGYPTANLRLLDELVPKRGVYAVRVRHAGETYSGVANIGFNPTFSDVGLSVEVHCFDFKSDIYDQMIRVEFVNRIREEKRFASVEELKDQIKKDCVLARELLRAQGIPAQAAGPCG